MKNPSQYLHVFNVALREVVESIDPTYATRNGLMEVGLEGSFGSNNVNPRTLSSKYISQMVCVEGIVSKCTFVIKLNS